MSAELDFYKFKTNLKPDYYGKNPKKKSSDTSVAADFHWNPYDKSGLGSSLIGSHISVCAGAMFRGPTSLWGHRWRLAASPTDGARVTKCNLPCLIIQTVAAICRTPSKKAWWKWFAPTCVIWIAARMQYHYRHHRRHQHFHHHRHRQHFHYLHHLSSREGMRVMDKVDASTRLQKQKRGVDQMS